MSCFRRSFVFISCQHVETVFRCSCQQLAAWDMDGTAVMPPVLLHSGSVNDGPVVRFRTDWSRKIPKKRTSSSVFCNTASDLQWQPLWQEIARRCKNELWPLWPCSPAILFHQNCYRKKQPGTLVSGCFEIGTVIKLFYPHQLLSAVFV